MAKYQTIVLLNLSSWSNPNKPGTGFSLDVVQTVSDGRNKGVGVERVYFSDNGNKRIGKPLFGADLNRVWENKAKIKELMDNPPPIPAPPPPDTTLEGGGLGGGSVGGGKIGGDPIEKEDF